MFFEICTRVEVTPSGSPIRAALAQAGNLSPSFTEPYKLLCTYTVQIVLSILTALIAVIIAYGAIGATICCASVVSNGGVPAGILSARRRLTSRERAEGSICPCELLCTGFGFGLNRGWVPFRDLGTFDAWRQLEQVGDSKGGPRVDRQRSIWPGQAPYLYRTAAGLSGHDTRDWRMAMCSGLCHDCIWFYVEDESGRAPDDGDVS